MSTNTETTVKDTVVESLGGVTPLEGLKPFLTAILSGTLGQTFRQTDEVTVAVYFDLLMEVRDAVGIVSTQWNDFIWAEHDQGRLTNVKGTHNRREAKEDKAPTEIPSIEDLMKKKSGK